MKKSRDIIIFIILIPIFLFAAFQISSRMEGQLPKYCIMNKSNQGVSIFYEALKKLNYPVGRTIKPVDENDVKSVQIIFVNDKFDVNDEKVKKWVEDGGVLVYLVDDPLQEPSYGRIFDESHGVVYQYHKGTVIIATANDITNSALRKNTDKAYELLQNIDRFSHKKMYFNEAYMFSSDVNSSLWDSLPISVKFICYQLVIVVLAFIYYKGKRFGKTIPLYDEVERSENEYLYSAASLYKQNKCWDLMLENYYKKFLKEVKHGQQDLLDYWKEQQLPKLNDAKIVQEFMSAYAKNRKITNKEYIQIINKLDELTNILKKRREEYWKLLKTTR